VEFEAAAVVAEVERAVGSDGESVRPAAGIGDCLFFFSSGLMRVTLPDAISTMRIEPSAIATGPSGNLKPDAISRIFILSSFHDVAHLATERSAQRTQKVMRAKRA
jgi:hypothetical protein